MEMQDTVPIVGGSFFEWPARPREWSTMERPRPSPVSMFFLKQKRAYEMIWRLEFRRVLFRSRRDSGKIPGMPGPSSRHRSFLLAAARRAREDFDVATMVQAYQEFYENIVDHSHRLNRKSRSEERRVGEESRSRWSPDHYIKKC